MLFQLEVCSHGCILETPGKLENNGLWASPQTGWTGSLSIVLGSSSL